MEANVGIGNAVIMQHIAIIRAGTAINDPTPTYLVKELRPGRANKNGWFPIQGPYGQPSDSDHAERLRHDAALWPDWGCGALQLVVLG